jgi:fructose-bisphosphate aldolase class I
MNEAQLNRVRSGRGFIAALDQSGGSTPHALESYGIGAEGYADDDEMFDRIHEMRTRIMTSAAFDGERILGAILFEDTMDRDIQGQRTATYLWEVKQIVPFVKVDKGLTAEADGVQVMKPMPELDALLKRAAANGVFATKMRSLIKLANAAGIETVVGQQFEFVHQILAAGLVPIIEPEIDIHSPQKADAEQLLKTSILQYLGQLGRHESVMVKVTLPEVDDFYADLVAHPNVLRVLALSGGYSRAEACARLARNHGVIASFSRALTEGLTVDQTDEAFATTLGDSINSIFQASIT